MKLYKPKKLADGDDFQRGWASVSWNGPYEPGYFTLEQFPGKRYWIWGVFTWLKSVSEALHSELSAEGWEPWNEKTKPFFQILESHLAQTLLLNEEGAGVQYWAQTSALAFAQEHPVLLTYETGEEDHPTSIPVYVFLCVMGLEETQFLLYSDYKVHSSIAPCSTGHT